MSPDTQDNSEHFADLNASLQGDCSSDAQLRGLYATDASVYQVMPKAVVHPRNADDIATVIKFASENALPVLPRGAGTSQNGQTVNDAIVLDNSRYFNQLLALDVDNARCTVEPGMVLDTLNRQLKPHGLWFLSMYQQPHEQLSVVWQVIIPADNVPSSTAPCDTMLRVLTHFVLTDSLQPQANSNTSGNGNRLRVCHQQRAPLLVTGQQ